MAAVLSVILTAAIFASACGSPTSPGPEPGVVSVDGVVRHFNIEGGFWAVSGDDGVVYQPMHGLDSPFRRENLRVSMVAKVRHDLGGIHMVGPIVEVVSIRVRDLSTGFPVVDPRR
jgi:hypothetical protein